MFRILLLLAILIPPTAYAQSSNSKSGQLKILQMPVQCGPTNMITKAITDKYSEEPKWSAMGSDGLMVSLWSNEQTKSFTILKSSISEGLSCIVGSGEPLI